ncbi:MAG: DNA-directed RNA polymerase subunit omega [Verrucomicrobia bacterium]|nr:DNA-directed RNA polymerase subunit omega [Verrucomicrobiota bacterium]NBU69642.1 DNA-directed RNA polymerase subunit omega [Verrucomicrobiota bacterium]NDC00196.1 DNA-directed RNA polymerase subunit omega [Verrucomicrobiota bacterium]
MRSELVHRALSKVANPQILINVVSKRVRQLGLGYRPMIVVSPRMTFMDVALHEIADGKLGYEVLGGETAEAPAKPARKTRAKKSS